MTSDPPPDLVVRLRPHLRHRFDGAGAAWWSPPPRRWRRGARTRLEQLTQVVELVAMLIDLGDPLTAAVTQVAQTGSGRVTAELRVVADALSSGSAPADAFHDWARRATCGYVGVLAADVRGCASSDALAAALWRNAASMRRAAHELRIRALRRRVGVLWLVAVTVCGVCVVLALP